MIELTREVRFSLIGEAATETPVTNSWGGWPSATRIAPWLTLQCTVAGSLDPDSGYLHDISDIDRTIRQQVVGPASRKFRDANCESFLVFAWQVLCDHFSGEVRVTKLRLSPTPFLHYSLHADNDAMFQLTQQFEFSASHRLHNPDLSDEENRKLFGKCNNPHGHGHNYVVDVTIVGETCDLLPLPQFESIVKQQVIDRLDHRNLNLEVDEFRELNPSVENIAMVIWRWLNDSMGDSMLDRVRVFETPKTWADYRGTGNQT
ncbi:MAG: 6-carboxytetrahydropterin synthase [Pirellulaceae bacterium]